VRRSPAATRVALLVALPLVAGLATAQEHRFRLSAGGGAALGTIAWTSRSTWEVYRETAELGSDSEAGPGPALEAALTVRVSRRFALKAAFAWSRRDTDASVRARIPHPFFFERPRSIEADVSSLEYRQLASHVDLEWRPLVGRTEISLFGGVSLLRVEADLVERVEYDEEYPYDAASFRMAVTERARSDARAGWSVGAAMERLLGSRFGLGVQARYTRARLDLAAPGEESTPVDAGGLCLLATLSLGF
jgi:hypothetical protein